MGHECSFVYDVADLYKAEITIPIAFEIAAANPEDLPGEVRRRVRDEIASKHLLERMVKDIRFLLLKENEEEKTIPEVDVTYLWDTKKGIVANGKSYSEKCEE
ncbi:MAG: hypothetical protein ACOX8E_03300 [Ruminococcus sp.]